MVLWRSICKVVMQWYNRYYRTINLYSIWTVHVACLLRIKEENSPWNHSQNYTTMKELGSTYTVCTQNKALQSCIWAIQSSCSSLLLQITYRMRSPCITCIVKQKTHITDLYQQHIQIITQMHVLLPNHTHEQSLYLPHIWPHLPKAFWVLFRYLQVIAGK